MDDFHHPEPSMIGGIPLRLWQQYSKEFPLGGTAQENLPAASIFFFAGMRAGYLAALCICARSATRSQKQRLDEHFHTELHQAEVWALDQLDHSCRTSTSRTS